MTTRCAWCADPEPARPVEARVSHGICPSCLEQRLVAKPRERVARRAPAPAPLRWLAPQPAPLRA